MNYVIYSYEFEIKGQKYAYVGITRNLYVRNKSHRSKAKNDSSVLKFSLEYDVEIPEPNILECNLNEYEAQSGEFSWCNYYRDNGYILINKAKTGLFVSSVGGKNADNGSESNKLDYRRYAFKRSKDVCLLEASLYSDLKSFRSFDDSLYQYTRKNGWLGDCEFHGNISIDELCDRIPSSITDEVFYDIAKRFHNRTELKRGIPMVYYYGYSNNLLDKIYGTKKVNEYVDDKDIVNEVKSYKTRRELRLSNIKLYNRARTLGLLSLIPLHEKTKKQKYIKVNKNDIIDECLKKCVLFDKDNNMYVDFSNCTVYKKLKTKCNSVGLKTDSDGYICFSYNNKTVLYHNLFLQHKNHDFMQYNLVGYVDGDLSNIKSDNFELSFIDLSGFKECVFLQNYLFNKEGLIYDTARHVMATPELIGDNLYFKSFRLDLLIAKAFISSDVKLSDIEHIDGNNENCTLENLRIKETDVQRISNIVSIETKENGSSLISLIYDSTKLYLGCLNYNEFIKEVCVKASLEYKENKYIPQWLDTFKNTIFKEIQDRDNEKSFIEKKTLNNGCYWHKESKSWKSKVFYKDREWSLGYFSEFEKGKLLYDIANLHIKYGTFLDWYKYINDEREHIKSLNRIQ